MKSCVGALFIRPKIVLLSWMTDSKYIPYSHWAHLLLFSSYSPWPRLLKTEHNKDEPIGSTRCRSLKWRNAKAYVSRIAIFFNARSVRSSLRHVKPCILVLLVLYIYLLDLLSFKSCHSFKKRLLELLTTRSSFNFFSVSTPRCPTTMSTMNLRMITCTRI